MARMRTRGDRGAGAAAGGPGGCLPVRPPPRWAAVTPPSMPIKRARGGRRRCVDGGRVEKFLGPGNGAGGHGGRGRAHTHAPGARARHLVSRPPRACEGGWELAKAGHDGRGQLGAPGPAPGRRVRQGRRQQQQKTRPPDAKKKMHPPTHFFRHPAPPILSQPGESDLVMAKTELIEAVRERGAEGWERGLGRGAAVVSPRARARPHP